MAPIVRHAVLTARLNGLGCCYETFRGFGTWNRSGLNMAMSGTTATLAHNNGMDATQLLGYSARWVTQKYYLDSDMGTPMNVGAVLPKLRHRNTSN